MKVFRRQPRLSFGTLRVPPSVPEQAWFPSQPERGGFVVQHGTRITVGIEGFRKEGRVNSSIANLRI